MISSDRRTPETKEELEAGPFVTLDALNLDSIAHIIHDYEITTIYHLASILSAK